MYIPGYVYCCSDCTFMYVQYRYRCVLVQLEVEVEEKNYIFDSFY